MKDDRNTITIYTDGSCYGNQNEVNYGGWGAVLLYKEHKKTIYDGEKNTTNNRMEMTAVIKALESLKRNDLKIRLHTDSAYISNCINQKWYIKWRENNWKNSKKQDVENKDLWVRLLDLYESFDDIEFIKVKGHDGVELNELADDLANKGSKKAECLDM